MDGSHWVPWNYALSGSLDGLELNLHLQQEDLPSPSSYVYTLLYIMYILLYNYFVDLKSDLYITPPLKSKESQIQQLHILDISE